MKDEEEGFIRPYGVPKLRIKYGSEEHISSGVKRQRNLKQMGNVPKSVILILFLLTE